MTFYGVVRKDDGQRLVATTLDDCSGCFVKAVFDDIMDAMNWQNESTAAPGAKPSPTPATAVTSFSPAAGIQPTQADTPSLPPDASAKSPPTSQPTPTTTTPSPPPTKGAPVLDAETFPACTPTPTAIGKSLGDETRTSQLKADDVSRQFLDRIYSDFSSSFKKKIKEQMKRLPGTKNPTLGNLRVDPLTPEQRERLAHHQKWIMEESMIIDREYKALQNKSVKRKRSPNF